MSKSDIGQVCDMAQEKLTPLGYKNVDLNLQQKRSTFYHFASHFLSTIALVLFGVTALVRYS